MNYKKLFLAVGLVCAVQQPNAHAASGNEALRGEIWRVLTEEQKTADKKEPKDQKDQSKWYKLAAAGGAVVVVVAGLVFWFLNADGDVVLKGVREELPLFRDVPGSVTSYIERVGGEGTGAIVRYINPFEPSSEPISFLSTIIDQNGNPIPVIDLSGPCIDSSGLSEGPVSEDVPSADPDDLSSYPPGEDLSDGPSKVTLRDKVQQFWRNILHDRNRIRPKK